jgi:hypothetical protein
LNIVFLLILAKKREIEIAVFNLNKFANPTVSDEIEREAYCEDDQHNHGFY